MLRSWRWLLAALSLKKSVSPRARPCRRHRSDIDSQLSKTFLPMSSAKRGDPRAHQRKRSQKDNTGRRLKTCPGCAGGPPTLQVGPSCEAAGSGSVVAGRNKDSCLADENTARDTLKQNWPKYLAADKSDCVTLENSGGPASYVELLSCLEVMRDARTIQKEDPLGSDLEPAPASGSKLASVHRSKRTGRRSRDSESIR
jgi:hypothetical protein